MSTSRTPSDPLGIATLPVRSVPIKSPWITLRLVAKSEMKTPAPTLPEIRFSVCCTEPPIVLPSAPPKTSTPSEALDNGDSPSAARPMKLCWTTLSSVVSPEIATPGKEPFEPSKPFPEMKFPPPSSVVPMRFPEAPPEIVTPPSRLPTATVPVRSVPMKFRATTLPVVPASEIATPLWTLPEITFSAPGVGSPMKFADAPPPIATPSAPFPRGSLPLMSVPMRLPSTMLPDVPACSIATPSTRLAEMTLRPALEVSPTTLSLAPPRMSTPSSALPSGRVPVTSVPMKFRSTTFPEVPELPIWTPSPPLAEITFSSPGCVPPTRLPVAPAQMMIPPAAFPSGRVPVESVPIRLPWIAFPEAP